MSTGTVQQQAQRKSFLEQLETDTFGTLMGTGSRPDTVQLEQHIESLDGNIQKAMLAKDARLKQAHMAIVEADVSKLHKSIAEEEQDLAVAMVGLKELMEKIGLDYTELTQPSAGETSIVTAAECHVKTAEFNLMTAQRSWFFKQKRTMVAQKELDRAKSALDAAKTKSQQLTRKRLMSATLDKSLQHFITQVARVVDIMTQRCQAIDVQLAKVTQRHQQALQLKQQAAARLQELDTSLDDEERKLHLLETERDGLINGSPEYSLKEAEVARQLDTVETIRGERNTALAIYNSKERFAQELQIHTTAQRKLRDNQRIWIAVLKSDTQERLVTFASRLEAMKGMADQQVAQGMDQIGTEIDGRNAETLARAGAASDKIRMEMFEAQPERVQRILNAMGAQAEAIAQIRKREQEAVKAFHERYGIQPQAQSFFTYTEEGSTAS